MTKSTAFKCIFLIPIFIFLFETRASANTPDIQLEELAARLLRESRSFSELQAHRRKISILRSLRKQCRMQLSGFDVPVTCFASLALEHQMGLINAEAKNIKSESLEAICRERSREFQDLRSIAVLKAAVTSSNCHAALVEREKDLKYQHSADHPLLFWRDDVRDLD